MRIGNLDDMSSSENSENLAKLIKSDAAENMTKPEKWKNWWHYHKWYVVWGVIVLGISCNLIGHALGLWEKQPDFQIAYVGKVQLPQDTAAALEEAFAALSSELPSFPGTDFNGDGSNVVRINQYLDGGADDDVDVAYTEYASEISLIGDISDCESYFFLMDNPDNFQKEFQLLACLDGSCPDDSDFSADNKFVAWQDCPALADITAYVEQKAPGSAEILKNLYFGRRCFYTDAFTENYEKCGALWDFLVAD